MVEIVGERVRLRDVTPADADLLEELESTPGRGEVARAGRERPFGQIFDVSLSARPSAR